MNIIAQLADLFHPKHFTPIHHQLCVRTASEQIHLRLLQLLEDKELPGSAALTDKKTAGYTRQFFPTNRKDQVNTCSFFVTFSGLRFYDITNIYG